MSDNEDQPQAAGNPPPPINLNRPVQGIHPPSPLNLNENISENWKLFKQKWMNYSVISNLQAHGMPYQVALLLHTLGDAGLKVFNGFQFDTAEEHRTVNEIFVKFDTFAVGEVNETYERFIFNRRDQNENEPFESFLTSIRNLFKTCNYCIDCGDSILRDRIVLGIRDSATQATLMKERRLTLANCIDICKTAENASVHTKTLRKEEVINKVYSSKKKKNFDNSPRGKTKECKFCGKSHVLKKELCPAWGKTCSNCKGKNHFARKCNGGTGESSNSQKAVHNINNSDTDSEKEWINSIKDIMKQKDIKCRMKLNKKMVVFQVDTGASINLLPVKYTTNYTSAPTKLRMWNNTELTSLGTYETTLRNPKTKEAHKTVFTVVKEDLLPIIGLKTAQEFDLIHVNNDAMDRCNAVDVKKSDPIAEFPEVFDDKIGTLSGLVSFKVNDTPPVTMPARRIPLSLRPQLKEELDSLVKKGVLLPVNEPTPWVSQMAVVKKKDGRLRICIDPRELNKALIRERYTMPILEESLHELGNSQIFTKVDLSSGYWHVQLDHQSSMLTTFQTSCSGRFRFLRLPFGTSVSAEIFQRKLLESLSELTGIVCIADDVIIHGKTVEEHDKNFNNFLLRCEEKGIKLNKKKMELRTSEVTFMGHKITKDGLQADPAKVEAVLKMPVPTNVHDLRRFTGLITYLAKFVSHLTDTIQPLNNLTKKDVPWNWSRAQQDAFDNVKSLISKAPTLTFYDPKKELTLENDSSEYGLGSCLYQCGRPIAFASRSLTDTERRWAQIEKELLAVTFGLTKFHHYTYGRDVTVITDHKPLISIVKKPLSKAPKRLQMLLLRTQEYNFTLNFKPGTAIPVADALSRLPLADKNILEYDIGSVNNVTFLPINSDRLSEIRNATEKDESLNPLKENILHGWPTNKILLSPQVTPYFSYRDELSLQDGIIVRGERILIPKSLRFEIKQKLHVGHMGINSCLRRARELVFWPGMSKEIRQFIEACDICSSLSYKQSPEPLILRDTPSRPWERVGSDLFSISGRDYLITVDYYSNYFEIDYLLNTSSATVINKLKHHFSRHGIPDSLVTDNGPQYNSADFKLFCKKWSIKHEPVSPGNSKSNGAAEASVKIAKNIMKKCINAGEDQYLGLLNFRNTPTEGLASSPAQRLFGRRTKSLIPTTSMLLEPRTISHSYLKEKKDDKQFIVAQRFENRRNLTPLKLGDSVRMQPIQTGKKVWEKATVTKNLARRSYEVIDENGRKFRRSREFLRLKPLPSLVESTQKSNESHEIISSPVRSKKNYGCKTPVKDVEINDQSTYTTRSGRVINKPQKLNL